MLKPPVLVLSHMFNRFKLVFKCVVILISSVWYSTDPCAKKHCGAGRVCELTEEGEAECVCIPTCPEEVDPRRKVRGISKKISCSLTTCWPMCVPEQYVLLLLMLSVWRILLYQMTQNKICFKKMVNVCSFVDLDEVYSYVEQNFPNWEPRLPQEAMKLPPGASKNGLLTKMLS
jgi:hypothetical protein